jgi:hypothetical protein
MSESLYREPTALIGHGVVLTGERMGDCPLYPLSVDFFQVGFSIYAFCGAHRCCAIFGIKNYQESDKNE